MTIRKLDDGQWLVDCRPEGRYGPRIRKKLRTKNEALNFQNRIMGDGARGEFEKRPARDERRLSELVRLWFSLHGQNLKTGAERLRLLEAMAERMGDPKAYRFDAAMFAQYRAERAEGRHVRSSVGRGRRKGAAGKGVGANTLNHELAYLSAVFSELSRLGEWRGDNPLASVRPLKFDDAEMVCLELDQVDALLDELNTRDSAAGLIAEVCLSTGARWGEAESLQVRQVHGSMVHYSRTKSSKNRSVPISKDLERRLLAALPFRSGYNTFRRAVEAVGLDLPEGQLTHVLRHTFASHYHAQRWRHHHVAAGPGPCLATDDHALCPFQSWPHGRGGPPAPARWTVWTFCGPRRGNEIGRGCYFGGPERRKPRSARL
ncbi:TPA: phage integrase [Pseudomonas aeruginosa]